MDYISIPERSRGYKARTPNQTWIKRSIYFCFGLLILCVYRSFKAPDHFSHSSSRSIDSVFSSDPELPSVDGVGYSMKSQYQKLDSCNTLQESAPIRAQLAYYFPYDANLPIPRSIYQTWKVPVDHQKFPRHLRGAYLSWEKQNTNYSRVMIPDKMLDDWVYNEFGHIPLVIKTWNLLPKIILKADFFRYLVVFARGGIYSDMDTLCLKPVDTWAPFQPQYKTETDHYAPDRKFGMEHTDSETNDVKTEPEIDDRDGKGGEIGCVIGIEADPDREDWAEWYARRVQFAQWTVMAKKGHPFLRELIARIIEETLRREELGTLKTIEGKDAGGDIMSWTGPGIYTDTAFDYLNNVVTNGVSGTGFGIGSKYWQQGRKWLLKEKELDKNNMPLHSEDMQINWQTFTNLKRPAIVDDVMILPITGFSPGVAQMGSKPEADKMAFVKHMFHGSWKPGNERMK